MNKGLTKLERSLILQGDKCTCQKCKLEDRTAKKLEIHHIKPLVFGGSNEHSNLITLCLTCHKYAPNSMEEFNEFMDSEMDGLTTALLMVWKRMKGSGEIEKFEQKN